MRSVSPIAMLVILSLTACTHQDRARIVGPSMDASTRFPRIHLAKIASSATKPVQGGQIYTMLHQQPKVCAFESLSLEADISKSASSDRNFSHRIHQKTAVNSDAPLLLHAPTNTADLVMPARFSSFATSTLADLPMGSLFAVIRNERRSSHTFVNAPPVIDTSDVFLALNAPLQ